MTERTKRLSRIAARIRSDAQRLARGVVMRLSTKRVGEGTSDERADRRALGDLQRDSGAHAA